MDRTGETTAVDGVSGGDGVEATSLEAFAVIGFPADGCTKF